MTEKLYIGIDGKREEAKGEVLEHILKDRAESAERERLLEAEQTAKAEAKDSAMAKLRLLGLTDEEITALIP